MEKFSELRKILRHNCPAEIQANKQISLSDQGLTRSFHFSGRERFPKHQF